MNTVQGMSHRSDVDRKLWENEYEGRWWRTRTFRLMSHHTGMKEGSKRGMDGRITADESV